MTRWTPTELGELGQAFLDALVQRSEKAANRAGIDDPFLKLEFMKTYLRRLGLEFDGDGQLQPPPEVSKKVPKRGKNATR